MNCLYCQQSTEYHKYKNNGKDRVFYSCWSCDTYFVVNKAGEHVETNIWLPDKIFVFCIDIVEQKCCLYNRNKSGPNNQTYYEEFRLSHIPDWTPQNIVDKIKTILIFS
jgi:hypothetical protein